MQMQGQNSAREITAAACTCQPTIALSLLSPRKPFELFLPSKTREKHTQLQCAALYFYQLHANTHTQTFMPSFRLINYDDPRARPAR